MSKWEKFSKSRSTKWEETVKVGLVAKYVGNDDTYICVTEALKASAAHNHVNLELKWINAEEVTDEELASVDGIVVPGGFGIRGMEGKIKAATYALENDKPYLGLCLGLQMACVAAARRGGLKHAGSEEFLKDENYKKPRDFKNVIYIMPGQEGKESTGGTMRLGDYPAVLSKGTKTAEIYRKEVEDCGEYVYGTVVQKNGDVKVIERHRHRYEVNQEYLLEIERGGIMVSGTSPDGKLVEFVEAPECKFFVATQAHPEFKSRPLDVHPLFYHFIKSLK